MQVSHKGQGTATNRENGQGTATNRENGQGTATNCISDRHKKNTPCRGPSNDHSWAVWFQLSKWFQRRSVLKHFSHRVQC